MNNLIFIQLLTESYHMTLEAFKYCAWIMIIMIVSFCFKASGLSPKIVWKTAIGAWFRSKMVPWWFVCILYIYKYTYKSLCNDGSVKNKNTPCFWMGGGGLGRCPLPDIALESQDCTLKQTLSQRELHHERDPIGRMSLNKPCPISMHTTRSCSCPLKHATNKLLSACPHTHLIYWHRPNL